MQKIFYISILAAFLLLSCHKQKQQDTKQQPQAETISVKVSSIKEKTITETVKLTGEIVPLYQVDVFPKANGIVVSEAITLGSEVHKGQVLAKIRQDIPGMEFSLSKITATKDGIITMDALEIGGTATMQRPAYSISGLKQVYMEGKIIETYLGKIKIGQPATVTVDAFAQRQFNGKIAEISPILDRLSRTAKIKILLQNSNLLLKPGMFATAKLTLGSHSAMVVPLDAIVRSGAYRYLFTIKNGKAQKILVTTGIINGTYIEIQGDISVNDKVVVFGQNLLEDGTPVRIIEEQ